MPSSYTPPSIATPVAANLGGTGIANNALSTLTITGNFGTTFTVSGATSVTLPTSGTLATLAGAETLTNKTISGPSAVMAGLVKANAANAGAEIYLQGDTAFGLPAIYMGVTPAANNFALEANPGAGQTTLSGSSQVRININGTEMLDVLAGAVAITSGTTFQLGNNATTGLAAGVLAALTNATIVIKDATGQSYRIPCII